MYNNVLVVGAVAVTPLIVIGAYCLVDKLLRLRKTLRGELK